jgi:hypothetical protein
VPVRACVICCTKYQPNQTNQRYCTPDCKRQGRNSLKRLRRKSQPRIYIKRGTPLVCKWCDAGFVAKRSDRVDFCTRECAFAHKAELKRERAESLALDRADEFTFCIDRFWLNQLNLKKTLHKIHTGKFQHKPVSLISVACAECGHVAESYYRTKRCKRCAKRRSKRRYRAKHSSHKHRSRAKRYGVAYEPITLSWLYHRDKGKCALCGGHIDHALMGTNDNLGPSIDHIIEMELLGPHTKDNVQLAHRICNSEKQARRTRKSAA